MGEEKLPVFRSAHESMSTIFELILTHTDKSYAAQVSQAVFEEIDHIEGLLNRFDPGSEISRINRLKPGQSMNIGVEVFECLELADRLRMQTSGAFDINIGSLLKYQSRPVMVAGENSSGALGSAVVLSKSSGGFRAAVPRSLDRNPSLDLGGIGKGFALDKIREILADWGVDNALIHGGTSSALAEGRSVPDSDGWPVGVGAGCPQAPDTVILNGRAVSGSGFEVKGEHIMDPRTLAPARGHRAAWVSHTSAAAADALSTAFIVMDTEEVARFCRQNHDTWVLLASWNRECHMFNRDAVVHKKTRSEDRK